MNPTMTASHVPVAPKILYFGTPVVLISTENPDGSSNLAPISSAWALGKHVVVGLGRGGQSLENLERTGECVLNLPSPELWQAVERLAPLTGKHPVPAYKAAHFRYESDKFGAAGLTPVPAEHVRPARVLECPLQIEGRVVAMHSLGGPDGLACAVEVEALQTYADPRIVLGPNHVDPTAWSPLIYNFRHYFGLGTELGRTFRADTPR
jgi:flavin reductase (DIM6/NTAB) family NADH-FMN oxidoreductase RutF